MGKFGFGTQLFGFNKVDVNAYLLTLHQQSAKQEQEANRQIKHLNKELEKLTQYNADLKKELDKTKEQLSYYIDKESEIEKMSVSIGTMYLVAKQNAAEMISAAEQYAKEVSDYSEKQLDAADRAGEQLAAVREELSKSADRFSKEVAALVGSLDQSRRQLTAREEPTLPPREIEVEDGGSGE